MHTPRAHLKIPQSTPRKPQEPRRTFFSAKNGPNMAKNDQKPLKYAFLEIFRAIFSAKKSARRVRTPRAHLQLPQSTPRKTQEPRRTFCRPKTASKWPKTTKNRQNTHYFEIFRAIFSAKKCAKGAHTPYPLATTLNHPQKSLRNPGALFSRPKTASKWPKTTKNRQNTCF